MYARSDLLVDKMVSSSVAPELIKSFVTAIRTPQYDWFGLSLRYTVYPKSGLNISIEIMFAFSQCYMMSSVTDVSANQWLLDR